MTVFKSQMEHDQVSEEVNYVTLISHCYFLWSAVRISEGVSIRVTVLHSKSGIQNKNNQSHQM